MLVKNKIRSQDEKNNLFAELASKLESDQAIYIKHKPNRKIIGLFKYHLGMYGFGTSIRYPWKNDSFKWRRYLRRIGEAPVILDTLEVEKSKDNLKRYLFGKGFYNADITTHIDYFKRKRAVVTYYINPQKAYIIDTVTLGADDAEIDRVLNDTLQSGWLKKGNILDVEMISRERNRLTSVMRNNGYYDFTKEYFDIEIDTLRNGNFVKLNISVSNKNDNERFVQKRISDINVVFQNDVETQDTLQPMMEYNGYNFYFNGYPIKPYIIAKNITLHKGDLFSQNEIEITNNRLSELNIFKFIDINFTPSANDSVNSMVMTINLKTSLRQVLIFEPQTFISQLNRLQNVSNSNSFGVAANLVWSHKNAFHNAEQFDISFTSRFETQLTQLNNRLLYSTQQSINTTLSIPRSSFLTPLEKSKFVKGIKTNYKLSFLYEFNPDYTRRILPFTYQYQIRTNRFNWFLNVFEMAFSKNTLQNSINLVGRTDSAYIQRLYSNNLVTSSSINFSFNNMATAKGKTFFIVRANVLELGGNIHRMIRRMVDNEKKADTSYRLFGVNYFQYAKSEIDVRCSTILSDFHSTCFRGNIGLAYPYVNQKVLPFDKSFFIGGSNSLRGWRPRTVGPGTYNDNNSAYNIDRNGDMIIQGSAEYRFSVIDNVLEAALFADAGNVWSLRKKYVNDTRKLFVPSQFLSSIAFNTGAGMRVNFTFFIFRFDWGWQMHNPELPDKTRWVVNQFGRNKYFSKYSVLNFGIGYPF